MALKLDPAGVDASSDVRSRRYGCTRSESGTGAAVADRTVSPISGDGADPTQENETVSIFLGSDVTVQR